ncbi:MAG: flagellar filament capping protein FliD [Rhodothermaceae bacterium]|nr:flagellar filament capping protein FliD [Rhodothermaceae bacterium]
MNVSAFNANDPYELLIAQIIQIERQPQFALQGKRSEQTIFKAVLSDFDSTLSALDASLGRLTDVLANPFGALTANVPEGAGFGVVASDSAAPGPHTLQVERLATADSRLSQQFAQDGSTLRSFFDTNGAQTFTVEVASPTEEDPDARVGIEVTVDPSGDTDAEILDEISTAIDEAMDVAADEGTIQRGDMVSASIVNETSDTARLSLRSGDTGFGNRLSFTDSASGLLGLLQVNSDGIVGDPVITTTPATAASFTGDAIDAPVSVGLLGGDLEIEVNGVATTVSFGSGSYTAEDIATTLSDELGADVDVEVVDGALQFTTAATGSSASLQITGGSLADDFGLDIMASPVNGTDETTSTQTEGTGGQVTAIGTSETDSALNSRFQLDGLTLYRSTNEITDAVEGITLSLNATGDLTTFNVGSDGESIVKEVEGFIKNYNDVLSFIKQRSNVDPEAGTRGNFAGDATIAGLRFGMRNDSLIAVDSQVAGAPTVLADLGIELNDDGTLKLADKDKLVAAAQADADGVQSFFSADDGLATRLQARLDTFLDTGGILDSRTDAIEARIDRFDTQIERWDDRLALREDQLRTQYAYLQEAIATFQSQQSSLVSFYL